MTSIRAALRALLVMVIAALTLTLAAPPAQASAPVVVHPYNYEGQHHTALLTGTITERGPPAEGSKLTAYDTDGLRTPGALARPDGTPSPATCGYDDMHQFVQLARGSRATEVKSDDGPAEHAVFAASDVAAKSADEVADIGHAGLRHQFPTTLRGKSQFYDDINLGDLASRTKGMDGFLQTNGNTRYVLRNPGGVGVDRSTGLPTDVFTVIRRPDGSVVTMFPGTSPKG